MADNVQLNSGTGGDVAAADEIPAASGIKYQRVKLVLGADGVNDGDVASGNPIPIGAPPSLPLPSGASTEATLALIKAKTDNLDVLLSTRTKPADSQLVNTGLSQPLTDTQLRATPVPVSGTVATGGLTDTELRATPVPVSGTVTTGGLTDAQLRATPVPVSGTVGVSNAFALDATLTGGTAKEQIYDPNFAQSASVDQLRGVRTSSVVRVFGDSFADGIGIGADAGAFTAFVPSVGTGTGGIVAGSLELRTGSANANAGATLQSLKTLLFIAGAVSFGQSGIQFPTTPTTWKIVARKDGVDTPVTSFNGTANTPDGAFHRYEMFYQGAGSCKFMVDSVLLHSLSGQPTSTRTSTLDFPIRYELLNDAVNTVARYGMFDQNNGYFFEAVYTAADLFMRVRGSSASRLGPAVDAVGVAPLLPVNSVQETGGNLDNLLEYFLQTQTGFLQDIRTELRITSQNTTQSMGLNIWDESSSMRDDAFSFLH